MTPDNKTKFAETLRATMSLYDREVTPAAMLIWWGALKDESLSDVGEALARYIKSQKGHFPPLPADVLGFCRKSSGHMPADEAWALALTSTDGRLSIVWTTQIAEAMGAAQPCLDAGDKYGARLAFLSAYERLTEGTEPTWFISLGESHAGRARAIDAALKRRLIGLSQASSLLPPDCQLIPTISGLLPPPEKTAEEKEAERKFIESLREALK